MLKIQNLELKLSGDSRSSRPKSTLSTCESLTETLDTENNPHSAKDCKANQPVLQPAGSHQHSYVTLPNSLSEDGGRSRVHMPEQSFGQQFCIQQDGASGTTSSGTLMSYSFKGELVHWGILVLIPQILILAVCFPPPVCIMSWDQNILQGSRWEYVRRGWAGFQWLFLKLPHHCVFEAKSFDALHHSEISPDSQSELLPPHCLSGRCVDYPKSTEESEPKILISPVNIQTAGI